MSSHSSSRPKAISRPKGSAAFPGMTVISQPNRQSISTEHHTLARSFVYSSFRPDSSSPFTSTTPTVHSTNSINEATIGLANVGVPDYDDDEEDEYLQDEEAAIEYDDDAYEAEDSYNKDIFNSSFRKGYPTPGSTGKASNLSDLLDNSPVDHIIHGQPVYNENDSLVKDSPYMSYTSDTLLEEQIRKQQQSVSDSYTADIETQINAHQQSNSYYNNDLDDRLSSYKIEPSSKLSSTKNEIQKFISSVRSANRNTIINECILRPINYLPAVFLGSLLNILDALSYGMIMFPIGETIFSDMGPHGLSMFYVSTIISQLVFSLGGSAFKSGIGSEMIEVTPFFHQMAISIMLKLGDEKKDEIIATTIVTFALSSMVTGLVFFVLGKCKLGKLVGFFPRHILVGCIGGVGYFLVVTGIEVSSRLEGGLEYNLPTLKYLLDPLIFCQWSIPLAITAILVLVQHHNHSPLIVPLYFMSIFVLFHLVVLIVPSWNLQDARDFGWVFQAQKSNEPWYSFYKFYDFKIVNWWVVLDSVPTMLALTFFGILHVPINVPALAVTIEMDEFDVDRELVAHGISNALSGLCGSIQNYLVYTNSVLFIRAGADSRLSGVMLAIATMIIMWVGPVIIGFIPVAVVGSLIYLLGYELLKEAVYDTYGKLRKFEYATVIIIVITMGAWDFVYGILVGALLACVSFVVEAGRKPVVSGIYTGDYARSIVVRHPKQQEFLRDVGKQIYVMKLQGSLFFGSIGGLEEKIRARFDDTAFDREPIKYFILDMYNVFTVDFSAAEGFKRIRNLLMEKGTYLLISSVTDDSSIVQGFKDTGLWETEEHNNRIQLFDNLNSALEWCENLFLETYKELMESRRQSMSKVVPTIATTAANSTNNETNPTLSHSQIRRQTISMFEDSRISRPGSTSPIFGSPRHVQLLNAARKSLRADQSANALKHSKRRFSNIPVFSNNNTTLSEPLPLILTIMQGVSDNKDEQFWARLCPYLTKVVFMQDQLIYQKSNIQPCVYLVESGLIGAEIGFKNLKYDINSSVLPLTLFGDLIITSSDRSLKYYSKSVETVVWKLDEANINKLKVENHQLYEELLIVTWRLFTYRFDAISTNILVSS